MRLGNAFKLVTLLVLSLSFAMGLLPAQAQTSINAINLSFPRVTKDGQTQNTTSDNRNNWKFDGELNLDDQIRYSWNAVSLDTACKSSPKRACGYLRVYINDDASQDNFITELGASPLTISSLQAKLKEGLVKLLFVYIDSNNPGDTSTKVAFSFNFKNLTTKPQVRIISPTDGVVLAKGINRDFILELSNFQLESTDSKQQGRGKLNIYYNETKPSNLVSTLSSSISGSDNKAQVKFNTKDVDFSKIPDSLSTRLIFALTRTNGELLEARAETLVKTNYGGGVNVGMPKVTITEPRKDRTNLVVDGNQRFILQIENFQILSDFNQGANEEGKGYLQIFIDDEPIKTLWGKNDFSLNDIGATDLSGGRKTVKVQLVNKDFTKLIPESSDTVDVIYTPSQSSDNLTGETQVQNNTWRIVIVILTVVLVIGGIAVLITKG
jgi:hypothetical protein